MRAAAGNRERADDADSVGHEREGEGEGVGVGGGDGGDAKRQRIVLARVFHQPGHDEEGDDGADVGTERSNIPGSTPFCFARVVVVHERTNTEAISYRRLRSARRRTLARPRQVPWVMYPIQGQ